MRNWFMKKRLWIILLAIMALCLLGGAASAETRATTYNIAAEAFPAAGGFVSGTGTCGWMSTVTLSVSANDGYRFVCWKEGGNVVSQNTTYAFQATSDRTLTAVFVADNTTVTLHPGNHGAGTFLTLSTANAPIAPSQADAENGQFYLNGSNQIAFRLDNNYCPSTLFPAEDGYAFAGWTVAQNGNHTDYTASWKDMGLSYWSYNASTNNSECVLTGLTGSGLLYNELYIPKELNGIPVTGIMMSFRDFSNLETIYFHKDTLIDMMPNVENCYKLKNIHLIDDQGIVVARYCLPASITTIRPGTFAYSGIETLTLSGVTLMESSITGTFEGCNQLSSLAFEQAAAIQGDVFAKISSACRITYPGPIADLPWNAASYSPNLVFDCTDGTCGWCGDGWRNGMSDYDGSCMHWAMDNSGNLTVDSFGSLEDLFETHQQAQIVQKGNWDAKKIRTLTVDHASGIGMRAFGGCSSLERVTLPGSVTSIGRQAFESCSALSDLYFDGSGAQWNNVSKHQTWNNYVASDFQVHWRCTVTFDANGHGTAPQAQTGLWSSEDTASDPGSLTSGNLIFNGWFANAGCTQLWDFSTPVPGDMTLYAGWNTVKHHVSLLQLNDEGATLAGAGDYEEGAAVTLSAQPSEGHYFIGWHVHSGGVTIADDTFTMPGNDVVIIGRFGPLYGITLEVSPAECGTATAAPAAAPAQSTVTLTAQPNDGYHFREWRVISDNITIENDQFTMPAEAVTVMALFAGETPYPITSDTNAVASIFDGWTGSDVTEAVHGEELSLHLSEDAIPQPGYYFTGEFTVDGVNLGREYDENQAASWPIVHFTMPNHPVDIAAVQAPRESITLDFTQSTAQTMAYTAWVQLQSHDGLVIIQDEDGREFIDLDESGMPDIAVTPAGGTELDYTLTLLPNADADGLFSYGFSEITNRYSTVTMLLSAPAFGPATFTLPAALTAIEAGAFEGDASITVVDAHNCTSIGAGAFQDCTGLTQIRVNQDCQIDDTAFTGCGMVYVFAPAGGDTETWCNRRANVVFVEKTQD